MTYASRKARRYAEAVYSLATEQGVETALVEALERLAETMAAAPELQQVLIHRQIPRDRKVELARQAAATEGEDGETGELPVLFDPFVRLVLGNGRVRLLAEIAVALREKLDEQQGVVRATVTTAVPLLKAEREMIAAKLASLTGAKSVALETKVTKEVVGGVIIHVEDHVIDASVSTYLDTVRDTLRRVRVADFAEQGFLQLDIDKIRAEARQGKGA